MKLGVETLATMTAQKNVKVLVKVMTRETMGLRKKAKIHEKESEQKTNLGRMQAKKEKKTKLEKSMESLQGGLRGVAEMETESFLKLEDLCQFHPSHAKHFL